MSAAAGVGVGGEYPMASSSAAERAEGSRDTRKHRGRAVVLTFSQQVPRLGVRGRRASLLIEIAMSVLFD